MDSHILSFLNPSVEIVQADENGLFALEKPASVRAQPLRDGEVDSNAIFLLPYNSHSRRFGKSFQLLNRIDSPTSGLLLVSSNEEVAKAVRMSFSERSVRKTYYAYCQFHGLSKAVRWADFLEEKRQNGELRVVKGGRTEAITCVFPEKVFKKQETTIQRLRLEPVTGRTHQLRIQCALRQMPILGDKTYGNFSLNRRLKIRQLQLKSAKIQLSYKLADKIFSFACTSPQLQSFFEAMEN